MIVVEMAPSLLLRKTVKTYGGAEVRTEDGMLKWIDLVLIYKFAYQTTTSILVG